jgi:hypothetical protein
MHSMRRPLQFSRKPDVVPIQIHLLTGLTHPACPEGCNTLKGIDRIRARLIGTPFMPVFSCPPCPLGSPIPMGRYAIPINPALYHAANPSWLTCINVRYAAFGDFTGLPEVSVGVFTARTGSANVNTFHRA